MSKAEKIAAFDANGLAMHNTLFGLPFSEEESEIIAFPVPWEVTVSYAAGTADGPDAIFDASAQVDLFDPVRPNGWQAGIFMPEANAALRMKSDKYRVRAEAYLERLAEGKVGKKERAELDKINKACAKMVDWVEQRTGAFLDAGKKVILVGGDHSTPLGYLKALAQRHKEFGILQVDAHADLRDAYEGFTYSHASIMTNALKINQIKKLVQVGIRDYCQEEAQAIASQSKRITTYFDRDLKTRQYKGETWAALVDEIVAALPKKVYLSFDIDGLDPKLCPHTGTPVAGGFEAEQVLYLAEQVVASGRTLIGMDLNEVAPGPDDEWDANVAARMLYRLALLMA
jgi:agmatinase